MVWNLKRIRQTNCFENVNVFSSMHSINGNFPRLGKLTITECFRWSSWSLEIFAKYIKSVPKDSIRHWISRNSAEHNSNVVTDFFIITEASQFNFFLHFNCGCIHAFRWIGKINLHLIAKKNSECIHSAGKQLKNENKINASNRATPAIYLWIRSMTARCLLTHWKRFRP